MRVSPIPSRAGRSGAIGPNVGRATPSKAAGVESTISPGKAIAEAPTSALGVGPFIAIMTPAGSPSDGSGARLPGR